MNTRVHLLLLSFALPLTAHAFGHVETSAPKSLHTFSWKLVLLTVIFGAIATWVLYKKETSEEKYWILFFSNILPYAMGTFIISLIFLISFYIFPDGL